MATERSRERWWAQGGHETCPFCLHRYWYEAEVRCLDCDRPVCPSCVVRVRGSRETFCPECDPALHEPSPAHARQGSPHPGERTG